MPVDYAAVKPEERQVFEKAFRDLLELQKLWVHTRFNIIRSQPESSIVVEVKPWGQILELPLCIHYKPSFNQ